MRTPEKYDVPATSEPGEDDNTLMRVKTIKDFEAGDFVRAYDAVKREFREVEVQAVHEPQELDHCFEINGTIRIVPIYQVLVKNEWTDVETLEPGQELRGGSADILIDSFERVEAATLPHRRSSRDGKPFMAHSLEVAAPGSYVINGVVVRPKSYEEP